MYLNFAGMRIYAGSNTVHTFFFVAYGILPLDNFNLFNNRNKLTLFLNVE